jgi:hypothetical protein
MGVVVIVVVEDGLEVCAQKKTLLCFNTEEKKIAY